MARLQEYLQGSFRDQLLVSLSLLINFPSQFFSRKLADPMEPSELFTKVTGIEMDVEEHECNNFIEMLDKVGVVLCNTLLHYCDTRANLDTLN